MRYCENCGKQIQENVKFCPYCGHQVRPMEDLKKRMEESENNGETETPVKVETVTPAPNTSVNSFKEINEVSFLEKWGTSARINKLVKIYSGIMLAIMVILFAVYKNADNIANGVLESNDGASTAQGILGLLHVVPVIYYGLIIFGVVILVFTSYRFLRDFKGKVHGVYGVMMAVHLYALYHLHDIFDLMAQLGNYGSQAESEGFGSLLTNDYSSSLSSLSGLISSMSSYKMTIIVIVMTTILLLVVSILSKMQLENKVTISPWLDVDEGHTVSSGSIDVTSIKNALHSSKVKKIGIGVIVIALCGGGFGIWNKYFNRTDVDVLKNVKLEYDGISGEATASVSSNKISYSGDDTDVKNFLNNDLSYTLSKSTDVSNGDTITVKVSYNKENAEDLKLNLKDTTKKIKVSGLEYRFDQASDIPSFLTATLRQDADVDIYDAYEDTDYDSYKVTYVKSYFIKSDDAFFGDKYVACYKIDETDTNSWDGSTSKYTYYAYAYTSDLTSAYSSDDSTWNHSYFDSENVTSSDQLPESIASDFYVEESQVEAIS